MKPNSKAWQELEKERLDTSYRNVKPKFDTYAPKFAPVLTKRERKVWFDAGRYAAGERDNAALKGHSEILRIVGQK